mmetsp:Transcript_22856/g.60215  ORF Transcript_22856/g.60215 Transcript_22856/m.60215 type:complete len:240 (+) Transcript_22856:1643-2362(+)
MALSIATGSTLVSKKDILSSASRSMPRRLSTSVAAFTVTFCRPTLWALAKICCNCLLSSMGLPCLNLEIMQSFGTLMSPIFVLATENLMLSNHSTICCWTFFIFANLRRALILRTSACMRVMLLSSAAVRPASNTLEPSFLAKTFVVPTRMWSSPIVNILRICSKSLGAVSPTGSLFPRLPCTMHLYRSTNCSNGRREEYPCCRRRTASRMPLKRSWSITIGGLKRSGTFSLFGLMQRM